jgi:fucose permease
MVALREASVAWSVLLFWGLFRNAPFPVVYALLIDSIPTRAGSAMGLMIGFALGTAGVIAAPMSGWIIDHYGFTAHYVVLAFVAALCYVPLRMIRETVHTH